MKSLRAVMAAVLLAGVTSVTSFGLSQPASAAPVICETFGSTSIQNGQYIVQNNVWGADTAQCIDVNQNGGFTVTQAAHNKATNGAPAAYPSIYRGCHYNNCSSGSNMPIQVSQISSATSSIGVTYPGGGTWNAAYDIWLDPTPRTNGQNGAELMIWLNRQGSIQPIGSPIGNATIAGRNWEVWYGNTGWHVISYVSPSPVTSYSFSVSAFINDVVGRGYINSSWYLTSIQAGFEPWIGGAGLAVTSFSASVNGGSSNPPPPPPPPPGGCTATATVQSQWAQGYVMQVRVTNSGTSPINGWTVSTTLPSGHQRTNHWNADVTTTGQALTAQPIGWNANLAPGQQTDWGFQASRPSGTAVPTSFSCTAS